MHKDVVIKEGEAFLLPSRVPHSPQRQADTLGLVIERERLLHELDGMRFYIEGSTDILYERWFHCVDLGTQLKPIIEEFLSSEEAKTGRPGKNSLIETAPFEPDSKIKVMQPINVTQWLKRQQIGLKLESGFFPLFKDIGLKSSVGFYGPGRHVITTNNLSEMFLWQWVSRLKLLIPSTDDALFLDIYLDRKQKEKSRKMVL